MTIVIGQIESLKELKNELNQNGITKFHSISEINNFIKNYDSERNEIPKIVKNTFDDEIKFIKMELEKQQWAYEYLKDNYSNEIKQYIKYLDGKLANVREKRNRNLINRIIYFPKTIILENKKSKLERDFEKLVHRKTRISKQNVKKRKHNFDEYIKNKAKIISDRCEQRYKEIDHTKEIVDGLYTLIAGAIGENLVVKELSRLSDSNILFNDFSIKFDPPIFNKKENDRIYSIQIDHLLLCNSGIFILETKNWSRKSIESFDLRSPVKQILRTSYAIFVLLNSESEYNKIKLTRHHWGDKQIPVRNVIVMINEKPTVKFKHVKVLSLDELIGYITYFETVFSDDEVKSISDYLRTTQ